MVILDDRPGLHLIEQFEALRLRLYYDLVGVLTIGWGHAVLPGEDFSAGITPEQAEALLRRDADKAERSVRRLITAPLTVGKYGALVSFVFNLGGARLQASRLRLVVNRGDDEAVPGEFKRWCLAGGRVVSGLLRRREAEASLYASA